MSSLILASQSHARKSLLENAGLEFETCPANLDEKNIVALHQENDESAAKIANVLAVEKARSVVQKYPKSLVIGCDQVLDFEGKILCKAKDIADARDKLLCMRGKEHRLISAASIVQGDEILWQGYDIAALKMHNFSNAFLDEYCSKAGDALVRSVGAYELEGLGVQLFEHIEGDYFTILGLPLLKILAYLRQEHGVGL